MSDGKASRGRARVMEARRDQLEWRQFDFDGLISRDHVARLLWLAVERLDLGPFYTEIEAREGEPGRPAHDPKVLLTLWLYATSEGVGSARQLARLCERDHAYQWICGGLRPNHHSLSDFRVGHGAKLDTLLTQLLASLMKEGVVKLRRVAQDGVRVRADAGAASFRRGSTLRERCLAEAEAQVAALRDELEADPASASAREKAARERAVEEQLASVQRALAELPKVAAVHAKNHKRRGRRASRRLKKDEPRVSTTDPEARVMKMGDGGFRPAYNVQFATSTESRLIVGVAVTAEGTDMRQMGPMLAQIRARTGQQPTEYLVDGGYTKLEAIEKAERRGIKVYAPVPRARIDTIDSYARKSGDSDEVARWRARMGTEQAKEIYKERAAVAETVHADLRRWRGLNRFSVRGKQKVAAISLLHALSYNLLRVDALRAAAA